jgi:hypothetical protein
MVSKECLISSSVALSPKTLKHLARVSGQFFANFWGQESITQSHGLRFKTMQISHLRVPCKYFFSFLLGYSQSILDQIFGNELKILA